MEKERHNYLKDREQAASKAVAYYVSLTKPDVAKTFSGREFASEFYSLVKTSGRNFEDPESAIKDALWRAINGISQLMLTEDPDALEKLKQPLGANGHFNTYSITKSVMGIQYNPWLSEGPRDFKAKEEMRQKQRAAGIELAKWYKKRENPKEQIASSNNSTEVVIFPKPETSKKQSVHQIELQLAEINKSYKRNPRRKYLDENRNKLITELRRLTNRPKKQRVQNTPQQILTMVS